MEYIQAALSHKLSMELAQPQLFTVAAAAAELAGAAGGAGGAAPDADEVPPQPGAVEAAAPVLPSPVL